MNLGDFIKKECPAENISVIETKPKKFGIYDILNSATFLKKDLDFNDEDVKKTYNQFVVNRWLSMCDETFSIAMVLNRIVNLTNEQHFALLKSVLGKKQYCFVYLKKTKDLTATERRYIADYFKIGLSDAQTYIQQMDDTEISAILEKYKYGENKTIIV